ncbi:MAG: hypothetical protein MI976_16360 [Pseudomonadales bacterium]|nr:hypothetical protein [Pseudomonadales bacterium]
MNSPHMNRDDEKLKEISHTALVIGVLFSVIPLVLAYGFEDSFSICELVSLHISAIVAPVFIKLAYVLKLSIEQPLSIS